MSDQNCSREFLAFDNVKAKDWYFVLDVICPCDYGVSQSQNWTFWILDCIWVVDILLPDHVGLPYVLDLAVHLVHLSTWMGLESHKSCDYSVTLVPIGLGF